MIRSLVRRAATVMLITLCVLIWYKHVSGAPSGGGPRGRDSICHGDHAVSRSGARRHGEFGHDSLENELAGVADLKRMMSNTAEGVSLISLEFEPEANIDEVLQRVRDRVSTAKNRLPPEADDTAVNEVSFADLPVMIVTISGPVDPEELKFIGEAVEEKVKRIPGVMDAKLSGGRTRQIRVQIDPMRLEHFGLKMVDVISSMRSENVTIPGGDMSVGDASYLLRVPGEFTSPEEIEQVAIKRKGDRPVFIRDVGQVVDGYADRTTYARMNGESAVSLAITKRTGANILTLSEEVKALVEAESSSWPEGVYYRRWETSRS